MRMTRAGRQLGIVVVLGTLAGLGCSSGGAGPATGGAGTTGTAGSASGSGGAGVSGASGSAGVSGAAGSASGGAGVSGASGSAGVSGVAGAAAGTSGGAGVTGAAGATDGGATDGGTDQSVSEGGGGLLALTSTAFTEGATIPNTYTCAGGTDMHMSPPLAWTGQPAGTKGWAIVLKDTTNMFTHWAIWDISPTAMALAMGVPVTTHTPADPVGAKQVGGNNQSMGYISPCPPAGQSHTYVFTLYAQSALPLPGVTTAQTAGEIETQLDKKAMNVATNNVGTATLSSKVTH